jgi:hypothetical protein
MHKSGIIFESLGVFGFCFEMPFGFAAIVCGAWSLVALFMNSETCCCAREY